MSTLIRHYQDIEAYRLAFGLQQQVFRISRGWPSDELHSLTTRALAASRAIGAELSQAMALRADPAEFVTKLSEVDAELAETLHWLETAHCCGYLEEGDYQTLRASCATLSRMLGQMALTGQKLPDVDSRGGTPVRVHFESRP